MAVGAGVRVVGVVERRRDPQRVDAEVGRSSRRRSSACTPSKSPPWYWPGSSTPATVALLLGSPSAKRSTITKYMIASRQSIAARGGQWLQSTRMTELKRAVAVGRLARVLGVGEPCAVDDELVDDHLLVVRGDRRLPAAVDLRHRRRRWSSRRRRSRRAARRSCRCPCSGSSPCRSGRWGRMAAAEPASVPASVSVVVVGFCDDGQPATSSSVAGNDGEAHRGERASSRMPSGAPSSTFDSCRGAALVAIGNARQRICCYLPRDPRCCTRCRS